MEQVQHTLEALIVEVDLIDGLLLGATRADRDSFISNGGTRGVPGGVRSLLHIRAVSIGRDK